MAPLPRRYGRGPSPQAVWPRPLSPGGMAVAPLPRLNTSSSDGPPSGRPSSAPWHSGSTSAASPPSALLRSAAPSILRHHTAVQNNDCAGSIAGSAVGGKRRGEAVIMPVDRHQQDCAQQQRQPSSQDWRSRTCAQPQQPPVNLSPQACVQQQQQQPPEDWGPLACTQQPQQHQRHDRAHCHLLGPGMAMEVLPELRNSMVAVTATAEQPRALSACWEYGIAIPISPPHLPHCAPQTSCSIASAAADSCDRGDPDVRAVALAERLWWAKLLD